MWSLQPIEMIFTRYWWENNPGQKLNKIIRRSLHTATEPTKKFEKYVWDIVALLINCFWVWKSRQSWQPLSKYFTAGFWASHIGITIRFIDRGRVRTGSFSCHPNKLTRCCAQSGRGWGKNHFFRQAFIVWMQIPFHWENAAQTITAIFAVFIDTGRQ